MKDIAHIVTTEQFNQEWLHMLLKRKDAIYESYLSQYLALRDQLNLNIDYPNTFGFMVNTNGIIPAKSGVVFHLYNSRYSDPNTVFNFGEKQRLLNMLEDHELDFNYQKLQQQLIQPMPTESINMAVMTFYTPHSLTVETTEPGCQLDDYKPQVIPGHQFFRLMNTHENKVFAMV